MNTHSIHRTLIRILVVIWVSGIAIVAVDLLVLDKEKKVWSDLKPITSLSFSDNSSSSEADDLRAQHTKYMTEGILPARPNRADPMPTPTAPSDSMLAQANETPNEDVLTIDQILAEAKQTELAAQIEPASGDISSVFIKDEFKNDNSEIVSNNHARDVLKVIHDLDEHSNVTSYENHENTGDLLDGDEYSEDIIEEGEPQQAALQVDKHEPTAQEVPRKNVSLELQNDDDKKNYSYAEPQAKGQVVIIIDDMGVSLRSKQVEVMDGPLTLSYLPYAKELPARTKRAQANGHELMVHMPMEAMNRSLDGGPRVLRTDTNDDEFKETVDWGLSQFDGYVGLNNHMGSRLTSNKAAMNHLMELIKGRNIYFVDSKTIGSSVAAKTAREFGIPYAERDVFLDHKINKAFVKNALKKLERIAYQKGYAIAIGHPHKETIEALKEWIPTLKDKGLTLVPASAVIKRPMAANDNIAVNQTY